MDIIPTTAANSASTAATAKDGLGGIRAEDFMKILIKQLQYQDPLKPMDNQQMVEQMSTIRELELNTRLGTKLEQITDQQRFGAAAALIGKHVQGTVADEEGNEFSLEGIVTSVRFTEKGDAILELDSGEALPLAKLQEVKGEPESAAAKLFKPLVPKAAV